MSDIVIVYHSGYGHTKKVAEAVAAIGRRKAADHRRRRQRARQAWADLQAAKTIVFGSPTYMGGPRGSSRSLPMLRSKQWFTQNWKDKLAAGFTNSATMNGDKLSTLHYFITLSQQHSMLWVGMRHDAQQRQGVHTQ